MNFTFIQLNKLNKISHAELAIDEEVLETDDP
jgi:hypothetical protein